MHRRTRELLVSGLVGLVVVALTVPPARAADGGQPGPQAMPGPSPSVTSPVTSPGASPTPTPSGTSTTALPAPPGTPAPGLASGRPDRTPSPAVPGAPGGTGPEPGSDGVLPSYGIDDAYWDAFLLLQERQQQLTVAVRALGEATRALAAAERVGASLAVAATDATTSATAKRLTLDRLAASLYQLGPPVAAVTAMLGAPEDFLSQVDTANNQDVAAQLVVTQAVDADGAALSARHLAAVAGARLMAAQQQAGRARGAVALARSAVAAAAAHLEGLAGSTGGAPQRSIGPDGCPDADVANTLRGGSETIGARRLCRVAIANAATPEAALALRWAFSHLGAAYACGGAGRMLPWRMDCSSLVARAYHEGAGLAVAGTGWAPSTREMVPWGGAALDPHYAAVSPSALRPGDLVLYDTGGATYRHVVIYLGPVTKGGTQWMLHTNACGDVAKVEPFWGFPSSGEPRFLVARRVVRLASDPPLRAPPLPTPLSSAAGPHR